MRQDTAGIPEVAKLDGDAQAVVVPTMLPNEREIAPAQSVIADLPGLVTGTVSRDSRSAGVNNSRRGMGFPVGAWGG